MGSVLAPVVAVEDERTWVSEECIPERGGGELNPLALANRHTDNLPSIQVDNRCQIDLLSSPPNLGEVGGPDVAFEERHN